MKANTSKLRTAQLIIKASAYLISKKNKKKYYNSALHPRVFHRDPCLIVDILRHEQALTRRESGLSTPGELIFTRAT